MIPHSIYPFRGQIQPYSWGGFSFIPQLLGKEPDEKKPSAEYWLGAHPNFPGFIRLQDSDIALNQFIKQYPQEVLGKKVAARFGSLPFLLKVLDVRKMLSIQVHPGKAAAEAAFARENEAGLALTAPNRNYRDDNHKPELMVALGDFWLLHGFKEEEPLVNTLSAIPEFAFLVAEFKKGGYQSLYEKVMLMEQKEVNKILAPIMQRIVPLYHNGELLKSSEDFWAARAVDTFCKGGHYDRGIFSIYFFNLLHLKKGEGIYQPAGMPHAYLEGQNVEIMANSDNVLRAGLTDKHIDVPELLKHVRFEATRPNILGSYAGVEPTTCFATEAEEFELFQCQLEKGETVEYHSQSAEIVLALSGKVQIKTAREDLSLDKGASAFLIAGTDYRILAEDQSEVFRATVPEKE